MAMLPLEAFGENLLLCIPASVAASIPWLVAALPQSLPPWSYCFLFSCMPSLLLHPSYRYMIALRTHPDYLTLSRIPRSLITFAKLLPHKETFTYSRDQDLVSLRVIIQQRTFSSWLFPLDMIPVIFDNFLTFCYKKPF